MRFRGVSAFSETAMRRQVRLQGGSVILLFNRAWAAYRQLMVDAHVTFGVRADAGQRVLWGDLE